MATEFWNGNMAAARAVQQTQTQVIAAYPITPQTHTVEYLSQFVADGELNAQMIKVESEHSALSACAGAAVVGARTFTASCSQGLALMTEVIYFTAGMRFPVVMAVANRTMSVPVNIWPDHQDTLVLRDSGWLQLYACNVQEIYDLMLCAFRIAEDDDVALPCIVSYDGFILSHASEPVTPIANELAHAFVPLRPDHNRPLMDTAKPQQFGEVLFPDFYPDYELKKHRALADSDQVIKRVFDEYATVSGRQYGLIDCYDTDDADIILVGIGSMMQTARATLPSLKAAGHQVGLINLRAFRPFPSAEIAAAVKDARVVCVLDRDIGYGTSGMVYPDFTRTLFHQRQRPDLLNFIIGTGGKDITPQTIARCVELGLPGYQGQAVFWPDARGAKEGPAYTPGLHP